MILVHKLFEGVSSSGTAIRFSNVCVAVYGSRRKKNVAQRVHFLPITSLLESRQMDATQVVYHYALFRAQDHHSRYVGTYCILIYVSTQLQLRQTNRLPAHGIFHLKNPANFENRKGCFSEGTAGPKPSSVKTTRGDRSITEITVHSKTQITNSLFNAFKRSTVAGGGLHLLPGTRCRPGCRKPPVEHTGTRSDVIHIYISRLSQRDIH